MEFGPMHSLIYGLICGFTQFLPVPTEAHRALYLQIIGSIDEGIGSRMALHLGALLALMTACAESVKRFRREQRLANLPARRRKRNPDRKTMLDLRLLRVAAVPFLLSVLAYSMRWQIETRYWLLAIVLAVNGIILYAPQFMPGANKNSLSLSAVDGFLIGVGGGLGTIPGISGMGALTAIAKMLGTDRQYALEFGLLLHIPMNVILLGIEFYRLISTGFGTVTTFAFFVFILTTLVSYISAYLGILMIRFITVKSEGSGFAFYCWGLALFLFVLYLFT